MKTQLTKLIILASLFLTACRPQNVPEPYIGEYLGILADGYCNNHCDYPKTPDEFISHYLSIKDLWKDHAISDTIQTVLTFLEKEKNEITWLYCHPASKTLAIGALYNDDTLFYKIGEWYLPYLYDKIYFYIRKHLEYPKSLEYLLRFDSVVCGQYEDDARDCWKVTRKYLCDNLDELEWIVEDDSFLIKSPQDTILYEEGRASDVRCHAVPWENNTIVFTDIYGKFDYREETMKDFKAGLRILRKDFLSKNQCVKTPLYMVEYRRGVGLSRFCENEEFSLDTKWFKEIEEYVSRFAQEHELQRILFYTFAY